MTTLTYNGRLPGVLCQPALPPRGGDPLRLDVAAFVGFAERGPLNTPVVVEDPGQYLALFGRDLLVAREGGVPVYAQMPGAVRAFFDNGGRRCYVVRVAGQDARANRFPIPGMACLDAGGLLAVTAPAAWVGRWSDRMSVGTQLRRKPLGFSDYAAGPPQQITAYLPTLAAVSPGELLCLTYDDGNMLYFEAAAVERIDIGPTTGAVPARITAGQGAVYGVVAAPPVPVADSAEQLTAEGWQTLPVPGTPLVQMGLAYVMDMPTEPALQPGDMLRLTYGADTLILPVEQVDFAHEDEEEEDAAVMQRIVSYGPLWVRELADISGTPVALDRLRFDLFIREGDSTLETWSDLSFGATARAWTDRLVPPDATQFDGRSSRLGMPEQTGLYLPLGMIQLPLFRGPLTGGGSEGLDQFDPVALFLDPAFDGYGVRSLMSRADDLLYRSSPPQKLVRLHSLIPVEEVALIAVPDLAHTPWDFPPPPPESVPETPPEALEPEEPDWSRFQNCPTPPPPPPPPGPVSEPLASLLTGVDSLPLDFRQQLAAMPELLPGYDTAAQQNLLDVHEAIVTLCAARADVVAVLSLPGHFKQREALDWQQRFTGIPAFRDGSALSYAAVYHGWTQIREPATPDLQPLRDTPPDGAICGMIAARERARGAWIAPANMPLQGIVGLKPDFTEDDWDTLYNHQINTLRHPPGRFTLMSAHTLSDDRLLLQISVRRLLIFLRKLALRRGQQYVFETNNERFRRRVQVDFENILTTLAARGALVNFQVEASSPTQNDYDNGRFIIELKIAPTNPVEFITLTLLRSGESLLEIFEG